MAYNVKFAKGSAVAYSALATKDPSTLYFVTDSNAPAFYLGEQKLSSLSEVIDLAERCDGEDDEIASLKLALHGISLLEQGSVLNVINNTAADIRADLGTVANLDTVNKTAVTAINEVLSTLNQDRSDLTITVETNNEPSGLLRKYTVKQGGSTIGVIDIPKDLVVKSGRLVTVKASTQDLTDWDELEDNTGIDRPLSQWAVVGSPTGETINSTLIDHAGTYLELVINNSDVGLIDDSTGLARSTPIYIDVSKLIDAYVAEANATQIQLTITGYTISARVVASSITATELATDAVITSKIANLNVTKAKLETSVQTSLELADTSVQDVQEGTTDYGFMVSDENGERFVRVHGLDTAALKPITFFDLAGDAENVRGQSGDVATARTVWGAHAHADLAEANAKAYTDEALTWGTIGVASGSQQSNENQGGGE